MTYVPCGVLALVAGLLLAVARTGTAQTVTQVDDVFTGAGTDPDGLGEGGARNGTLGGLTYFAGTDQDSGAELWVSDGSAAGTRRFADICPGLCSSEPENFHVEGSRVYFTADDGRRGLELWSLHDGDAAPSIVLDIHPGAGSSNPANFVQTVLLVGTVPVQRTYFTATDPLRGRELWRLANGFASFEFDIEPGLAGSNPLPIGALGNARVLLLATTGGLGREPHAAVYASSTLPPVAVPLIENLVDNGDITAAVSLGNIGLIAVRLSDGPVSQSSQLWRTLGSAANTERLLVGTGLSELRGLMLHQNLSLAFFTADTGQNPELFVSDGTDAGTRAVMDDSSIVGTPRALTPLGDWLLFLAGGAAADTVELWRSDGGSDTHLIGILPGEGSVSDAGMVRAADGQRAYLHHADQLLRTNSSGSQVGLVRALGGPGPIADVQATSGLNVLISHDAGAGEEPFHSDGTFAGTIALGNLNASAGDADPSGLMPIGERMTFNPAASDLNPGSAFSTEGSAATTESYFAQSLRPLGQLDGFLVGAGVAGAYAFGDGTAIGTAPFDGPVSRSSDSGLPFRCSAELDGLLYFIGNSSGGNELYRSDGSTAGTSPTTDIETDDGPGLVLPCVAGSLGGVLAVGGRVLFVGDLDGSTGIELLASNGIDPPLLVADVNPGNTSSSPRHLTRFGDRVVFSADTAEHGRELWISDGSPEGTQLLRDIRHGTEGSDPHSLVAVGDRVAFLATTLATGTELWATDGTAEGTLQLHDLFPGVGSAFRPSNTRAQSLFVQGRRLFFAATLPEPQRCPLYATDGTPEGIHCAFPLSQFDSFRPASGIVPLANGAIAFAAWEENDGEEIRAWWAGRLMPVDGGDIRPGPASAAPQRISATDRGQVYFSANDGGSGRELWTLDLTGFLFADGFD